MRTRNVNTGLCDMLWHMKMSGVTEDSRNGPVLRYPEPVMIHYTHPWERVLFCPKRNANPFFHLMEGIWMLGGGKDVAWINQFNSNMAQYSDDGKEFYGAYGYRWREQFDYDQLEVAAHMLSRDRTTRRVVVSMWDPQNDLGKDTKDLPCNTHIYFEVRQDHLNMTVCNRSNDMIWGMFGANAVHMSMLQEVMASKVGIGIGRYTQFTNNLHVYLETGQGAALLDTPSTVPYDLYPDGCLVFPMQARADTDTFLDECSIYLEAGPNNYHSAFLAQVVSPMQRAWNKRDDYDACMHELEYVEAPDWRIAAIAWITRRAIK
jgi:hypothetical protein